MNRETKFLHLKTPAMLGERVSGWRVCWLGGWDRGRLFYVVMVERALRGGGEEQQRGDIRKYRLFAGMGERRTRYMATSLHQE